MIRWHGSVMTVWVVVDFAGVVLVVVLGLVVSVVAVSVVAVRVEDSSAQFTG